MVGATRLILPGYHRQPVCRRSHRPADHSGRRLGRTGNDWLATGVGKVKKYEGMLPGGNADKSFRDRASPFDLEAAGLKAPNQPLSAFFSAANDQN